MNKSIYSDSDSDILTRITSFLSDKISIQNQEESKCNTLIQILKTNSFTVLNFEEYKGNIFSALVVVQCYDGILPLRLVLVQKTRNNIISDFELISIEREVLTHPIMDI